MTPIQIKSGAYRIICSRLPLSFWFLVSGFKFAILNSGLNNQQLETRNQKPETLASRRRTGDDFDDLLRDRRLTDAVHVERQRVDQLAGILRRRIHRSHA